MAQPIHTLSVARRGINDRIPQALIVGKNGLRLRLIEQIHFVGNNERRDGLLFRNHQEAVQHAQVGGRLGARKNKPHLIQVS